MDAHPAADLQRTGGEPDHAGNAGCPLRPALYVRHDRPHLRRRGGSLGRDAEIGSRHLTNMALATEETMGRMRYSAPDIAVFSAIDLRNHRLLQASNHRD